MSSSELEFVTFESTEYQLGWRFDDVVSAAAMDGINSFFDGGNFREVLFSPKRTIALPSFSIARTTLGWETLRDREDDELDDVATPDEFCQWLEVDLNKRGWRLPTEDEFEAACGHSLFPWGDQIPEGHPSGDSFAYSPVKSTRGLVYNSNTYQVELTRTQLKLGDGGESVCGGYPWPVPWLSLCPAYRVQPEVVNESFFDMLDDAQFRPVLLQPDAG